MRTALLIIGASAAMLAAVSCATTTTSSAPGEAASAVEAASTEPETIQLWRVENEMVMYVDGSVDKTVSHRYDAMGTLLETVEEDARGNLLYRRIWTNGADGPESAEVSDATGLLSRTEYLYDGRGRLVEERTLDPLGNLQSSLEYVYEDDRIVRTLASDASGVTRLESVYSYDGPVPVSVEYRGPGGSLEAVFQREMDGERILEERTVLPDGTVETRRRFEYSGNRLAGEVFEFGTVPSKSVRYEYDADGNILRETWSNASGRDYEIIERQWRLFEISSEEGA